MGVRREVMGCGEAVWNELRTAPECQVLALAVVLGYDPKMEVAQVWRAALIEET